MNGRWASRRCPIDQRTCQPSEARTEVGRHETLEAEGGRYEVFDRRHRKSPRAIDRPQYGSAPATPPLGSIAGAAVAPRTDASRPDLSAAVLGRLRRRDATNRPAGWAAGVRGGNRSEANALWDGSPRAEETDDALTGVAVRPGEVDALR